MNNLTVFGPFAAGPLNFSECSLTGWLNAMFKMSWEKMCFQQKRNTALEILAEKSSEKLNLSKLSSL
jgi:hypothetical protein